MFKTLLSIFITTTCLVDVRAYNIVLQLPNFKETENLTVVEDYDVQNRNSTNAENTADYFYIDFPKVGYQIFKNKMAQAMEIYESFMKTNPVVIKVDKSDFSNNGTVNLTILNNNITEKVYNSSSDMQQNPETNTESPLKVNVTEVYENNVQNMLESSNVTQNFTNNYSLPVLEISYDNKTDIIYTNNEENKTANIETSNEENKTTNIDTNSVENKTANYNASNIASFEENKTATIEPNHTSIIEANKTANDIANKPVEVPVGFFGKVSNTVTNIFHSLTSWF